MCEAAPLVSTVTAPEASRSKAAESTSKATSAAVPILMLVAESRVNAPDASRSKVEELKSTATLAH